MNKVASISTLVILLFLLFFTSLEIIHSFTISNIKWFIPMPSDDYGSQKYCLNESALESHFTQLGSLPYYHSTEFKMPQDNNSYRVFMLGEASLSGWPYSVNQSVEKKVNRILDKFFYQKNVEIISTSIAGFNSSLALSLIKEVVKYDPDIIVLYLGHNEFYGYNASNNFLGRRKLYILEIMNELITQRSLSDSLSYDYSNYDLETILPLTTDNALVKENTDAYASACTQFEDNIKNIFDLCSAAKIKVVLPILPDNLLIPPIHIDDLKDTYNADIIFNNARMALFRDGNKVKAIKLFEKARDIDAIRLRIPSDIRNTIKKYATKDEVIIANLDSLFYLNCKNYIPGKDLFLDYIHPNFMGMKIIASEFSRIIINNVVKKEYQTQYQIIYKYANSQFILNSNDSTLAATRIKLAKEKIHEFTKNKSFESLGNEIITVKS